MVPPTAKQRLMHGQDSLQGSPQVLVLTHKLTFDSCSRLLSHNHLVCPFVQHWQEEDNLSLVVLLWQVCMVHCLNTWTALIYYWKYCNLRSWKIHLIASNQDICSDYIIWWNHSSGQCVFLWATCNPCLTLLHTMLCHCEGDNPLWPSR